MRSCSRWERKEEKNKETFPLQDICLFQTLIEPLPFFGKLVHLFHQDSIVFKLKKEIKVVTTGRHCFVFRGQREKPHQRGLVSGFSFCKRLQQKLSYYKSFGFLRTVYSHLCLTVLRNLTKPDSNSQNSFNKWRWRLSSSGLGNVRWQQCALIPHCRWLEPPKPTGEMWCFAPQNHSRLSVTALPVSLHHNENSIPVSSFTLKALTRSNIISSHSGAFI